MKFFETGVTVAIQAKHASRLTTLLGVLDSAVRAQDMGLPGYDLHPLKGDLKGFWAVKVSGNWRLIFRFENGDAYIVNYLDCP